MNAYQYILNQISKGVEPFVVAMLSIFYYIINAGTTINDMTAENLATVMTELGFTYNTSTDVFNDGTSDYTIYQIINKVITDYYPDSETLNAAIMILIIKICNQKSKITAEEKTTLIGLL